MDSAEVPHVHAGDDGDGGEHGGGDDARFLTVCCRAATDWVSCDHRISLLPLVPSLLVVAGVSCLLVQI
jgi:hypothetical protein